MNNKYFSFPNSSINTLKLSFNEFLNDMKDSSLNNLLDNPKFNTYDGSLFKWDVQLGTGTATYETSLTSTIISLVNPQSNVQTFTQNLSPKLLPNTVYTLTIELTNTQALDIEVNCVGIMNLITGFSNSSTISHNFLTSNTARDRVYIYFKTPTTFESSSAHTTFSIINKAPTNELDIFNISLQKGSVEFFDLVNKDFFVDSTLRDSDVWKLTNDGVNYHRILLDGDVSSMADGLLMDAKDNVYYKLNINNGAILLTPSHIDSYVLEDGNRAVDEIFVETYAGYIKEHVNNPILTDDGSDDGSHKILDETTGIGYDIIFNDKVISFFQNPNSNGGPKADNFFYGYSMYHERGGEHCFKDQTGVAHCRLRLDVDDQIGSMNLIFDEEYFGELVDLTINQDFEHLTEYFVSDTPTMTHDIEGNHIIHDSSSLRRKWKMKVQLGYPIFHPVLSNISDEVFNSFRLGHDIDGNHILRCPLSGAFFRMVLNNGMMQLVRTDFVPIPTKEDMFASYVKGHDINGRHIWLDISDNTYYTMDNFQGGFFDEQTYTVFEGYREFHPDNINAKYTQDHKLPAANTISFDAHDINGVGFVVEYNNDPYTPFPYIITT